MEWNAKLCGPASLETTTMGLVCPMVLFGHNQASVQAIDGHPYPSWIPYCFGYIGSYVTGVVTGVIILSAIPGAAIPEVINAVTSGCAAMTVGLYAGAHRTKIREKYGIQGTECEDFAVHAFCSPCGLCQEATEIEQRINNAEIEPIYTSVQPHEPFSK